MLLFLCTLLTSTKIVAKFRIRMCFFATKLRFLSFANAAFNGDYNSPTSLFGSESASNVAANNL